MQEKLREMTDSGMEKEKEFKMKLNDEANLNSES